MDANKERTAAGALVLAGGGIDSTACIATLRSEGFSVRALHVDFGQPAATDEWSAVRSIANYYDVPTRQIKVSSNKRFKGGLVEGRNALLVFMALAHRADDEALICLGVHAGTPYFDCTAAFLNDAAKLVSACSDGSVRLIAPLLELTKREVVELGRRIAIPFQSTYSCQAGNGPCGECSSCRDRIATRC